MPTDRFGRFYEPGPESARLYNPLLADMPSRARRFSVYPRNQWEDEMLPREANILQQEGFIQRAPAPIGPGQYPQHRPNPWSIEQPTWYEPTPRGDYAIDELRPRLPMLPPSRALAPSREPYLDREPPSKWDNWTPGYNAPMYPEDFAGKSEPIPPGDPLRLGAHATQARNTAPPSNITITIGGPESGSNLENPTNPLSQFMNFWYPPQYQAQRQANGTLAQPPPMQQQRSYLPMMRQGTNERITWPQGQPVPTNEPIPWSRIDNPWRVVEQIERQRGR